ncbi:MAG: type I-E CRISPR-associated protein Cas6/Cse3/CasE [Rhodocyclaceae bacterium]
MSKLLLGTGTRRNPYELHRTLWRCFPDQPEATRDFLFRVEAHHHTRAVPILMLSHRAPTSNSNEVQLLATRAFAPVVHAGMRLRFRLRANPIKTISDGNGRVRAQGKHAGQVKSCRVPLLSDAQRGEWLERKVLGAAQVCMLDIAPDPQLRFDKKGSEGKIATVLFDGQLIVTEPTAFNRLLSEGIGPAKAFGCGLLSIAPA